MRYALALTALVAAGSLGGCSNSSASASADAESDVLADQTTVETSAEVGTDASGDAAEEPAVDALPLPYEAATPPSLGGIRVANFSATAPPVDFCFAPHDTAKWQGPILAAAGPQDGGGYGDGGTPGFTFSDGGTTGLGFAGVTSYFYLAPGQYDARFVAAGSPECSVPVVAPDAKNLPPLLEDGLVTVALFAEVGADASTGALTVVGFADDVSPPPTSVIGLGRFAVRFINAAPTVLLAGLGYAAPAFSVSGMQTGILPVPVYDQIFSGVAYSHASSSSPLDTNLQPPFVDENGYAFVRISSLPFGLSAATGGTLAETTFNAAVTQGPSTVTLAEGPTSVTVGLVLTEVLLVGNPGSGVSDGGSEAGGEGGAFQLLQCVDNAGAVGLGGPCSLSSQ